PSSFLWQILSVTLSYEPSANLILRLHGLKNNCSPRRQYLRYNRAPEDFSEGQKTQVVSAEHVRIASTEII
ncbi:hypothetical protein, partial [Candidatus Hakubella thermalkaliphila]|uniref:hypothetical protein n=1 Tax=Candidatus Hakubella thermalkaliphila TaxID=2754717 RepID=UPI001C61251D